MARITEVEIGDVRCFEGVQSARTRRITLLVGENGAGKSTFLGCYRTLAKLCNLHDLAEENHFDEPPFQMGGFDSMVRAGKTSFTLGGRFAADPGLPPGRFACAGRRPTPTSGGASPTRVGPTRSIRASRDAAAAVGTRPRASELPAIGTGQWEEVF